MRVNRLLVPFLIIVFGLAACGVSPENRVKDGTLDLDKSITVGKAFESYSYFKKVVWSHYTDKQGREIVQVDAEFDIPKILKTEPKLNALESAAAAAFLSAASKLPPEAVTLHYIVRFALNKGDKGFSPYNAEYIVSSTDPSYKKVLENSPGVTNGIITNDDYTGLESIYSNNMAKIKILLGVLALAGKVVPE